ncbi:hypothetical protein Vau01_125610 [Virgisporangium aurantiacum]|uniref:Uncharacterized protein n=1 Tax=Virgisporangium aurantiacum TaxID=175570 RepID=A0A8J3ZP83_9ACTN|nr:hypothetical protein Vau01_125610 [Virgisporangium aurantiacum]
MWAECASAGRKAIAPATDGPADGGRATGPFAWTMSSTVTDGTIAGPGPPASVAEAMNQLTDQGGNGIPGIALLPGPFGAASDRYRHPTPIEE